VTEPFERRKHGTTRTRSVLRKPGHYKLCTLDSTETVVVHQPVLLPIQERWNAYEAAWEVEWVDWDTAEPVPVKLPWWRRLFGPRIPRARVVQR
jgi:hypothetical protein